MRRRASVERNYPVCNMWDSALNHILQETSVVMNQFRLSTTCLKYGRFVEIGGFGEFRVLWFYGFMVLWFLTSCPPKNDCNVTPTRSQVSWTVTTPGTPLTGCNGARIPIRIKPYLCRAAADMIPNILCHIYTYRIK